MSNTKRGKVKITLDKERNIYFDLNALVRLEELGVDVATLGNGVKMSQIRAILFAGLMHEDKELTLEEVGALVTMENMSEVSEAIGKAMQANGKK